MSSLSEEIFEHWEKAATGNAWSISSLHDSEYRAWTLNLPNGDYGIAVPFYTGTEINESFADVRLQTLSLTNVGPDVVLTLSSPKNSEAFASLCELFVLPGENGKARKELVANPVSWWHEWKSLLGNRNVDARVYDVLGELVSLEVLTNCGLNPTWRGPNRASVDIDCGDLQYEVKSTLKRSEKTIQVHGLFQLAQTEAKRFLLFAQFEPSSGGVSINNMVDRLTGKGFSRIELEDALTGLGYPSGNSSRDQCFELLALSKYSVDDKFPHIAPDSFVGGDLPAGVTSINYGVSLNGIDCEPLIANFGHSNGETE